MTIVGFHNSHEQVHPAALLAATQRAEQAGFDAAMCSDHWAPWSVRQGHSGFAWTWLGAALATTGLPLGVVNAPGQRYHPAIIAQAAATLAAMFPGRFWVALGSGENVNEHITGGRWPAKAERDARLRECDEIIRALGGREERSRVDLLVRVVKSDDGHGHRFYPLPCAGARRDGDRVVAVPGITTNDGSGSIARSAKRRPGGIRCTFCACGCP